MFAIPLAIKTYLRVASVVGVLVVLVLGVFYVHHRFEAWRQNLYTTAYTQGTNDTNLKWQTASTKAATAELAANLANDQQQRLAISDYLSQMHALVPQLQSLGQQRITYVNSPQGAATCLDGDGVKLLLAHRKALGLGAGSGVSTATARTTTP
jgi:hypothetical protein